MNCPECKYDYGEDIPMQKFIEGWKHGDHCFIFLKDMTIKQVKEWRDD